MYYHTILFYPPSDHALPPTHQFLVCLLPDERVHAHDVGGGKLSVFQQF